MRSAPASRITSVLSDDEREETTAASDDAAFALGAPDNAENAFGALGVLRRCDEAEAADDRPARDALQQLAGLFLPDEHDVFHGRIRPRPPEFFHMDAAHGVSRAYSSLASVSQTANIVANRAGPPFLAASVPIM